MTGERIQSLNQYLQDLFNIYGIKITIMTNYTPNAAGFNERNHAEVYKMLERMVTCDNTLKLEIALSWLIQASNSLYRVD